MPAPEPIAGGTDQGQLEQLLGLVLAARGGNYERHVLASTLRVLAAWLNDQAHRLMEEESTEQPRMHLLLPAFSRPSVELLTRREHQIAQRVARGFTNRQIAEDLVIATSTTERHGATILG